MKYMGSKERICRYIVPIIQGYVDKSGFTKYQESFCGSCAIIEKIRCEHRYAYDYNKYLIALLQHVQNGYGLLKEVPRPVYEAVRNSYYNQDHAYFDWVIGNVGFLASYNGRFFDGGYAVTAVEHTKKGDKVRNYYDEAKRNLERQAPHLQGLTLCCHNFFEDFADDKIGDYEGYVFVFDPPYKDQKQYVNSKDFDYNRYYDICRKLSERNIVICCEQNMPDDFVCIWEKPTLRSLNPSAKSYSVEKLYTIGMALNI